MTNREYLSGMDNRELAEWMISHFIKKDGCKEVEVELAVKSLNLMLDREYKDGDWF